MKILRKYSSMIMIMYISNTCIHCEHRIKQPFYFVFRTVLQQKTLVVHIRNQCKRQLVLMQFTHSSFNFVCYAQCFYVQAKCIRYYFDNCHLYEILEQNWLIFCKNYKFWLANLKTFICSYSSTELIGNAFFRSEPYPEQLSYKCVEIYYYVRVFKHTLMTLYSVIT